MMKTHEDHDALVDYDDHNYTSNETEDHPVGGKTTTRCAKNGVDGDDNVTSRVNDSFNDTKRTFADGDIQVRDPVHIFMTELVDRAYTKLERTNITKRNTDETSQCGDGNATTTDRTVANGEGAHFVDGSLGAFMTQPYVLPERTGVQTTKVGYDYIVEPDTCVAGSINTNAKATFASGDGLNQMAITRSHSVELSRQKRLLQQEEERQREAEEEVEDEEVTKDVEVMKTAEPDPRGQTIQILTRCFATPV